MSTFQSLIRRLSKMPRSSKKIIMIISDYFLIASVLLLMLSIWLGDIYIDLDLNNELIIFALFLPIIGVFIFAKFGLYQVIVHYIGFHALWNIFQAVTIFTLLIVSIVFLFDIQSLHYLSVFIGWLLLLGLLCIIRIFARLIFDDNFRLSIIKGNLRKNVLVYGAGDAGIQLISAINHSSKYKLIGFVDDAKDLQKNRIHGVKVFSPHEISEIIKKHKISEVIVAIPSISKSDRLLIVKKLDRFPVIVRILPSMSELVEGKITINALRKVKIEDLLGRKIIEPDKLLLEKKVTGKTILVTGAGGSIGSEICRQLLKLKPKLLVLIERSELALYSIDNDLTKLNKQEIPINSLLGDINNKKKLLKVIKKYQVEVIYHAAAYKHVPIVEYNPSEGIENNVFGTLICAEAAIEAKVEAFILISTDKAVRPTNIMGATKRTAELIVQALDSKQEITNFNIVRFGNVLGSSGSVIPLFKKQIEDGGPVTVTNKDVIRYFMTIPEAVELVIQSGAMGEGGDVFVLKMGDPVKIKDLAEKMIHLSGLELKNDEYPNGDIEIQYTGLRAGEKLFEELLIGDDISETDNPLIMRAKEDMIEWTNLESLLDKLRGALYESNHDQLCELLINIVPEYDPQEIIIDNV